ncbi:MAG: NusG domain II-containing protein [Clostridia bacterium]|nr:NusG domain II-containing protein [Clostridia bacterium]
MKKLTLFKKSDLLIALAAAAAAVFFLLRLFVPQGGGLTAEISRDGKVIYEKRLSGIADREIYTVGGDIVVVVALYPDSAQIIESQCRDKICVNTGRLTRAGDTAVCLPARVSVTLKGEKASDEPDIVVG